MKKLYFRWLSTAAAVVALGASISAQKPDPTKVIEQHRASIGTPAALAAIKNQMIVANTDFTFKGSANVISGKGLLLTAGEKSLWGMNYASPDYPQDRFGYDGKNVKIGYAATDRRSLIGQFLYDNKLILKEGLLGGTLSAGWPLLQADLRDGRVRGDDTRTLDGKEVVVLSYEPKGGSDMTIKLFFDAKTFRHVRTEYRLVRSAGQSGDVDSSARTSGTIYSLVEEFSNFSKMGALVLPRSYKLSYSRTGTAAATGSNTTNRDAVWTFEVTDAGFNREIDDSSFRIDAK